MEEISFNISYLKKFEYWLFPIWIIIWVVVFSTIDLPREDRWSISTALMIVPYLIFFFLARFELKYIEFNSENFRVTYFNNVKYLFGKQEIDCIRKEISALKKKDLILLSNANGTIAKIRKKALNDEDWKSLNNYFN